LLLAVIVPILANGMRAYLIVMLGHFSNMTLAVGVDHIIYGAFFFGLVMMVLFYVSSFWRDEPVPTEDISYSQQSDTTFANQPFYFALLLIGSLNLIYPMGSKWLSSQQQAPTPSTLNLETALNEKGWKSVENPQWEWSPRFKGVSTESMVYFSNGESVFGIYQASFGQESQGGAELVNSQNLLVTEEQSDTWKTVKTSAMSLNNLLVDETVLSGSERNLVILRWYQVGIHNTNNPYHAKLFQLLKRLSKDSSPELQVILFTEAPHLDYEQAESMLKSVAERWLQ
jgi:EpsI family protein